MGGLVWESLETVVLGVLGFEGDPEPLIRQLIVIRDFENANG